MAWGIFMTGLTVLGMLVLTIAQTSSSSEKTA
jgi:hypothetical protein